MNYLELRRLAGRAQDDPVAREILHDALYDAFPAYRKAVDEAENLAVRNGEAWSVWFFPSARTWSVTISDAFEVHRSNVIRADLQNSRSNSHSAAELKRALAVYHVPQLEYADPTGTGYGVVRDVGIDRIVARRLGPKSWSDSGPSLTRPLLYERAFLTWTLERLALWPRRDLREWLEMYDAENLKTMDLDSWEVRDWDLVRLILDRVRETGQTPAEIARASRASHRR